MHTSSTVSSPWLTRFRALQGTPTPTRPCPHTAHACLEGQLVCTRCGEAVEEAPVQEDVLPQPAPLTPHYPCVVCGSIERWEDRGIWRCRLCWPPGSLAKQATPHVFGGERLAAVIALQYEEVAT